MPEPLTPEELRLIADTLRNHATLLKRLGQHGLLPDGVEEDARWVAGLVTATTEALADRVEAQIAA